MINYWKNKRGKNRKNLEDMTKLKNQTKFSMDPNWNRNVRGQEVDKMGVSV